MEEFIYVAGGDKRRLQLAALVQMTLPGPPIVYYGTEVGLSQTHGRGQGQGLEVARLPMLWGEEQDRDLLAWYRRLIEVRHSHPAIWQGTRTTLHVDEATWAYALCGKGSPLIVTLNNSPYPRELAVDVAGLGLREGEALRDLLGTGMAVVCGDQARLSLPAWNGGVWKSKRVPNVHMTLKDTPAQKPRRPSIPPSG